MKTKGLRISKNVEDRRGTNPAAAVIDTMMGLDIGDYRFPTPDMGSLMMGLTHPTDESGGAALKKRESFESGLRMSAIKLLMRATGRPFDEAELAVDEFGVDNVLDYFSVRWPENPQVQEDPYGFSK